MNIALRYFTGTGNSRRIALACQAELERNAHEVDLAAVTKGVGIPAGAEWIGLIFPVYAFGIPREGRRYLKSLETSRERRKAFVIVVPGERDESGLSIDVCRDLLRKKNIEVVHGTVIQMPINWTTFVPLQSREETDALVEAGIAEAARVVREVLAGQMRMHVCRKPQKYSQARFLFEYWAFKLLGIRYMWRLFNVSAACNGCGTCVRSCPTKSIRMTGGNPRWSASCEQCMRCVNVCPKGAIFQKYGRKDLGKQRYLEPTFHPLREEKAG